MDACRRREEELRGLSREGVPVECMTRWHWRVGTLHIWPAVGKWRDERTGQVGKLAGRTIRELVRWAGFRTPDQA